VYQPPREIQALQSSRNLPSGAACLFVRVMHVRMEVRYMVYNASWNSRIIFVIADVRLSRILLFNIILAFGKQDQGFGSESTSTNCGEKGAEDGRRDGMCYIN
jgi:hypothetical protein